MLAGRSGNRARRAGHYEGGTLAKDFFAGQVWCCLAVAARTACRSGGEASLALLLRYGLHGLLCLRQRLLG
jgi:hypothetical protein